MKLLFVENTANVSYNLAKRLRAIGYDVTLLARYNPLAGPLDLASVSHEDWIKHFRCESLLDKTLLYLFRVLANNVDIIHYHTGLPQGVYAAISRTLKRCKKMVWHCHGSELRVTIHNPKYSWLAKFNLKMANKVLVATPDILRGGTEFLPNPINTEVFKPDASSIDLREGHDYSIFCPSRIKWKFKGQNKFLFALKELKEMGCDCNLILVKYTTQDAIKDIEATKKLIESLGLKQNVTLIPPIHPEDMSKYYNSCDIVWAQMGLGHLGLISLEALACNKPTFVDFIYDKAYPESPPVIKVFTVQDIAKETEKLIRSSNFQRDTRWWILRYHSIEAVVERLTKIYDKLLSQ